METQIYTVPQLSQEIPGLSEQAIRWQIFNKETNGLLDSGAIIRNGRRILIDLPVYLSWLRSNSRAR